ncbi:hypothetical protein Ntsu_21500 [Nocardia sp. IFM 10818]
MFDDEIQFAFEAIDLALESGVVEHASNLPRPLRIPGGGGVRLDAAAPGGDGFRCVIGLTEWEESRATCCCSISLIGTGLPWWRRRNIHPLS